MLTDISAASTSVSGQISTDTTWNLAGSPYIVTSTVSVYNTTSTPTLTIESGVIVKFNQYQSLNVGYGSYGGKLAADNVTFTGTSLSQGWWGGINLNTNSDGSIINNSRVEYGGYGSNPNIYLSYASADITNSVISNSNYYGIGFYGNGDTLNIVNNKIINNNNYGIYSQGTGSTNTLVIKNNQISANTGGGAYIDGVTYSSLSIENNSFSGNTNYPLTFNAAYVDSVRNNTFTSNTPGEIKLLGGTVSSDSSMRYQGIPYRISGTVYVSRTTGLAPVLTIDPGNTLKFEQYQSLIAGNGIGGKLIADGVNFTGSTASKGWWSGINLDTNSDGSIINNSKIEYAGYGSGANIDLSYSSADITNNVIDNSYYYGIRFYGGGDALNILNNKIMNSGNYGIYSYGTGSLNTLMIKDNQISSNTGGGANIDGAIYSSLSIENNSFSGNTNYPLTFNAAYVDSVRNNTFISNTPNEIKLLGGTVSSDSSMRYQGVPYRISGIVYVSRTTGLAPVLTIDPGNTLKFEQYQSLIVGNGIGGKLIADGVNFTGSTASKGWWDGINLNTNSDGSIINNSKIEYAGYGSSANIDLSYSSADITNNVIDNSNYYGIRFYGGGDALNILNNKIMNSGNYGIYSYGTGSLNVLVIKDNQISGNAGGGANIDGVTYSSLIVENNSFSGNTNYPLTFSAAYVDSVRNNTFQSNTPNKIKLLGGTVSSDSIMRYQGIPYRVTGTIAILRSTGLAPMLTIAQGNTLEFEQYQSLTAGGSGVGGKLIADGVNFTGSTASKGWWYGINLNSNSDGSIINNSKIEYAGYGNDANIDLSYSSADITNNVIDNSNYYGIRFYGGGNALNILNNKIMNSGNYGIYSYGTGSLNTLVIKNNQISSNTGGGANIDGAIYSSLSIENNSFSGNTNYPLTFNAAYVDSVRNNFFTSNTPGEIKLLSGTVSSDSIMRFQGVPYRISGIVYVSRTAGLAPALTIDPGNTLKFEQYQSLNIGTGVGGKLIADGVNFTGSTASKGWWGGINLNSNSDGSIINNSKIEYAGYGNDANIDLSYSSADITNNVIDNSSYYGIRFYGSGNALNILNNKIMNSGNYGIYSYGTGSLNTLVIKNNQISSNAGGGAYIDGTTYSSLNIENNIFSSNSNYPLAYNAAYLNSSRGNSFISNAPDEIKILSGTIDIDSNMRYQGVPYRIAGTVYVYRSTGLAPTLTIEPGNTLKFEQYQSLIVGNGVGGKLIADTVTFTGSTSSKGWWGGINLNSNSDGSIINNSKIEYGGYGSHANVHISSSSVDVSNSIIANNSYAGIYFYGTAGSVNIINNEIRGSVYGINKYGSSALLAKNNIITGNDYGVYFTYSTNSDVYNNYFNNTVNAWDNGNNKWNISKTPGSNIIGGPNLGGNYWSDYAGVDTDLDGLGNTLLPYNSSGRITTGGDRHPLVYTGGNKPPVANCGPDMLKCENVASPVQFNGSASFDPDGTIVSYSWEFGDGTAGSGMAPTHVYRTYRWNASAYLPFTVNLTVTDNGGLTNTTSQKVVIWIAGDANGDGKVNILDAAIVGLKWNGKDPCADLNNDGKVNILDAAIIGLNWNKLA